MDLADAMQVEPGDDGIIAFIDPLKNIRNDRYQLILNVIPTFIGELLKDDRITVKVLPTNDTWYGMTYREDVEAVKERKVAHFGRG